MVAGLAALLIATGGAGTLTASLAPFPPRDAASLVHWKARLLAWLELAVVLLQVVGVGAFCLSRLVASPRWCDVGTRVLTAAVLGLGMSGTLCAWYGSDFALFAGGAMAVLLILVILHHGPAHAPSPSAASPFRPDGVVG
jgi:hypothetical protein